jgi:hypothetical protein
VVGRSLALKELAVCKLRGVKAVTARVCGDVWRLELVAMTEPLAAGLRSLIKRAVVNRRPITTAKGAT